MASNNFQDAAVIDGNYLGRDGDFAAIVRAIEAARELGNQNAFDGLRESELIPGPKATQAEMENRPGTDPSSESAEPSVRRIRATQDPINARRKRRFWTSRR